MKIEPSEESLKTTQDRSLRHSQRLLKAPNKERAPIIHECRIARGRERLKRGISLKYAVREMLLMLIVTYAEGMIGCAGQDSYSKTSITALVSITQKSK